MASVKLDYTTNTLLVVTHFAFIRSYVNFVQNVQFPVSRLFRKKCSFYTKMHFWLVSALFGTFVDYLSMFLKPNRR